MSMMQEQSMEITIKMQNVAVGSKIQVKYSNLDELSVTKKIFHVVSQSNNLQTIIRKIEQSVQKSFKLYYYDDDQKLAEFTTDAEILSYLSNKPKVFYKVKHTIGLNKVQNFNAETFQRLSAKQTGKIEVDLKHNTGNSIILEEKPQKHQQSHQISPKKPLLTIRKATEAKREADKAEGVKPDFSRRAQQTQQEINKILIRNHSELAKLLFPHANTSNAKFEVACSFCKSSEPSSRIMACESNLRVIACQECSQFLAYQLPFPFKVYTSPEQYKADLSKQPNNAEALFAQNFKREKEERNRRIAQQLSALHL